jgi:hypothetical protein
MTNIILPDNVQDKMNKDKQQLRMTALQYVIDLRKEVYSPDINHILADAQKVRLL